MLTAKSKYSLKSIISAKFIFITVHLISQKTEPICALEAPTVHLPNQGVMVGLYMKMFRTQNIKAYLGIQYAKAPRFAPPEIKVNKWNMIYNATSYGPKCWPKNIGQVDKQTMQIQELLMTSNTMGGNSVESYDEECLYLNIFIPDGSPGLTGYAVMVWFHGGDFSSGSPNDIDPFQMVFKQKVIVVTVAYRLNILGFLTTGDAEAPGNFGLMDQSAALLWIRKNIAHFGGDSKQVTIIGHSAGAISAGLHLTSGDWSRNAFHKVIMMSGNPLTEDTVRTFDHFSPLLDSVAHVFACNRKPTSMLIQCLKRLDAKILMDNVPEIEWGPVIDKGFSNTSKGFIEDSPAVLLKSGNYNKVPVMAGITDMEDVLQILDEEKDGTLMTADDFESFASKVAMEDIRKTNQSDFCETDYPIVLDSINLMYKNEENVNQETVLNNFISFHTDRMHLAPLFLFANLLSAEEDIYVYYFNMRPLTEFYILPTWISVPKYFDQIFIWGVPYMNNNMFINRWNSTDKKISEIVMTLWANFAKSSNPTSFNIYLKWNSYNVNNQTYLQINEDFNLKAVSENHKINFWNEYYPKLIEFAIECCSSRNTGISLVSTSIGFKITMIFTLCIVLGLILEKYI
ncbi:carboxylesterase 5A [Lucilia cuprina]|uniref:carboxylesterase 5A n=1 Tax=Lucilia cuprina TaxID=7375 RepID=UPI001F05AA1A|nr:carboxylesterase 5A [Lucilia cuprina]